MKTYLYERCQTCVVKACCSNVCTDYRKYILETFAFNILANPVSLHFCERMMVKQPDKLAGTSIRTIGPSLAGTSIITLGPPTVITKGIV